MEIYPISGLFVVLRKIEGRVHRKILIFLKALSQAPGGERKKDCMEVIGEESVVV